VTYSIRTMMFESETGDVTPWIELEGMRVVQVLDATQVRVTPPRWYVTVLVEQP